MPKIFSKDSKITLIEYGEHCTSNQSWNEMFGSMIGQIKKALSA